MNLKGTYMPMEDRFQGVNMASENNEPDSEQEFPLRREMSLKEVIV